MAKSKSSKYRAHTIRSRGSTWQVDFGTCDGKRVQRSYKTKEDAKLAVDAHVEERRLTDIDNRNRRVAVFDFTDAQRMDVMTALDLLPRSRTLTEAVTFFAAHVAPEGGQRTVNELLEDYLSEKEKANRRPATLKDIRMRIGKFARDYGATPMHEITMRDLDRWMDKQGYRQVSRDNYRRHFVAFFNFAKKRGYLKVNPAETIDKVSIDEHIPGVFTPKDARKLMRTAEREFPRMVPYLAIGLFAGLRPAEIEQLDWKDIDLPKRSIRVRPEVAKKRRQRYVDISDGLAEWLAPHAQERGPLYFGRYEFDKVRERAKIEWSSDIMRHSFGSYHLAKHEDAARTALQMGHTRTDVLFTHYRDLVRPEDAEAYWDIKPQRDAGIIHLVAAQVAGGAV